MFSLPFRLEVSRGSTWTSLQVQYKKQLQDKAESKPRVTASDTVFEVIRNRRSVFPKDYTGQLVSRYFLQSHFKCRLYDCVSAM